MCILIIIIKKATSSQTTPVVKCQSLETALWSFPGGQLLLRMLASSAPFPHPWVLLCARADAASGTQRMSAEPMRVCTRDTHPPT